MTDRMTMMAVYKADELTPFGIDRATKAMKAALSSAMSIAPREDVLALALAKTALETGWWRLIHQYNWGNIKAGQDYVGMYTTFKCGENLKVNGKIREYKFEPNTPFDPKDPYCLPNPAFPETPNPPGNPQTRFRAYANIYDGAYSYVDFVAAGRYRDAWVELLEGDAVGYVKALKAKNYFTADEGEYARAVVKLQQQMLAKLKGLPPVETNYDDKFFAGIRNLIVAQGFNVLEVAPVTARDLIAADPDWQTIA